MRVSQYLDLEDDAQLLAQAREAWGEWADQDPRLSVVAFDELQDWLAETSPAEADEVLHALATRAASDGGDDVAAAAVLAWVLLPGACALARELRRLEGDVKLMVAAQLWIEVRSFPWRRLRKVAANVLMNTRTGCLREVGTAGQVRRVDRAWSATDLVDPSSMFWNHLAAGDRARITAAGRAGRPRFGEDAPMLRPTHFAPMPAEPAGRLEVAEVLEWACENDVISELDRDVLLSLVEVAGEVEIDRVRRSNYGLTSNELSVQAAPRRGMSQATVRRRAARSIRALAAAADRYVA
ncbi:hypothetical protein [Nocardioides marmoraquaticus]